MTSGKKSYFESGRVVYLPVHLIRPNPGQPRKVFEQQALQELSESIVQFGNGGSGRPGWRGSGRYPASWSPATSWRAACWPW